MIVARDGIGSALVAHRGVLQLLMRMNLTFDGCNSYCRRTCGRRGVMHGQPEVSFDSLHLVVHKIFNASGMKNMSSGSIMWIGKKCMKAL